MQTASEHQSRSTSRPIRALFAARKALASASRLSAMRMRKHAQQADAAAAALG